MWRGIVRYGLIYGGALAVIAGLLQWAQYRHLFMRMPSEVYIAIVALIFVLVGIWVGMQLTPKRGGAGFERNDKAIAALGLTRRECEILEHLASGASNKEIARSLGVSPNTIKTHIANLYMKLEVGGRGKAVEAARSLALIP
ncbi:helix-turn-helix domain-containing protein [Altererythrobacter lutimaris]|uniref:LuxR family transcriptional regulator n=1 Tax=Altererythrobacter lutimaris TaxID=2743979 RepID=A0A850HHB9_9SPHN|nr:LuxR family transcriptional regulator [Altererythrobacter lutimaris]NVE94442.1 LuxR family transcriptional regulator [Altererythrobacter lutimaris]